MPSAPSPAKKAVGSKGFMGADKYHHRDSLKRAKAGPNMFLFEYCAAENSYLKTLAGEGCRVEQVTEHLDARTRAGYAHAMYECRRAKKAGERGLLWAAIPCVGGSARNDMNPVRGTPSFQRRLRLHRADFDLMWENFEKIAREVHR